MLPQLRSSFQDGAANPVGELDKGFRGPHALSSITPPTASLHFLPCSPSLSQTPPWKRKWAGERQAAGACFLGGRAHGKEASWRNRRGQMKWGPRFVPAGRMQGANFFIIQERFFHGPATPCGKKSSVRICQIAGSLGKEGRGFPGPGFLLTLCCRVSSSSGRPGL